jgi:Cu+-exporting ATPase
MVLVTAVFFGSCQDSKKTNPDNSEVQQESVTAENIEHLHVDIMGMTCEIGCARLIQSKLYKADGVKFAKVSFADSSGVISFDQNRITSSDIKEIIQNTAGGEIYTVVDMKPTDDPQEERAVQ